VTRKRYPNGIDQPFFFERACPRGRPSWMRTLAIWSESTRRAIDYCLIDDTAGLLWAANAAALELHVTLGHADDLGRADALVFDLDPGPPATIIECAAVGLRLRELLEALGLVSFPKTSGSKGLHVLVPLNSDARFEQTNQAARELARRLSEALPDLVTDNMRKTRRPGRVLVDWSQNDQHKTTVCVYSLRARPGVTASTPVSWDEVAAVAASGDGGKLVFSAGDVLRRTARLGDLHAPVLELRQELPRISPPAVTHG
jgi:bifunctional non-homologous end joining protein LigD